MSDKHTNVVSLESKFNAIKRLGNEESIKIFAADFTLGEVTVGDSKQKQNDREKWVLVLVGLVVSQEK